MAMQPISHIPGPGFLHSPGFGFEFELIYTLVIIFFCFLVYFRTREIYELTKYKGIHYFRNAFLFFGLAYAARLFFHLFQLTTIAFDFFLPRRLMFPLSIIPVGYLSTMAIFYLAYSTSWKRMKYRNFIIIANIVALAISAIAFMTRSPEILSLIQLGLLIVTIIIGIKEHRKKFSQARALYWLITIFWLINLFVLSPGFHPFEIKAVFQIVSIGVFVAIYYKVRKWVK